MKTDFILLDEAVNYYSNSEYPFSQEVYDIIGICMEVHRELGKGFLEIVYKDALEYEFRVRKIQYEREKLFNVPYKDIMLKRTFHADFFIYGEIILEVKAQEGVIDNLFRQTINYLAAAKKSLGLLVNFGEDSLKYKRVILTKTYS